MGNRKKKTQSSTTCSSKKSWACTLCTVSCADYSKLRRHLGLKHPEVTQIVVNERIVTPRLELKNPKKKLRSHCPSCKMIFPDRAQLEAHIMMNHKDLELKKPMNRFNEWKCNECPNITYRDKQCLSNHLHDVHPEITEMIVNGYIVKPKIKVVRKRKKVSRKCPHCSKELSCTQKLNKHIRLKHKDMKTSKNSKTGLKCPFCLDAIYSSKTSLDCHIYRCHPEENEAKIKQMVVTPIIEKKKYQCEQCSLVLRKNADLKAHLLEFHKDPEILKSFLESRLWKCTLCKNTTALCSQVYLSNHLYRFHPDVTEIIVNGVIIKPSVPVANKKMKSFEKQKIWKCPVCPEKPASSKYQFARHLAQYHPKMQDAVVNGVVVYPYKPPQRKCPYCFKSLSCLTRLTRHVLTFHPNGERKKSMRLIKKWTCIECPTLTYRSVHSLRYHLIRHHPGQSEMTVNGYIIKHKILRTAACPKCGLKLAAVQMNKHLRIRHGFTSKHYQVKRIVFSKCPLCGTKVKGLGSLRHHLRRAHPNVDGVIANGKFVKTAMKVVKGIPVLDKSVQYSCNFGCDFSHESRQAFLLHLKTRHGTEKLLDELARK